VQWGWLRIWGSMVGFPSLPPDGDDRGGWGFGGCVLKEGYRVGLDIDWEYPKGEERFLLSRAIYVC